MDTTTLETPASPATGDAPFVFGGRTFTSRLIVGTGKYATFPLMKQALEESAAEIVTVAVRRVNLTDRGKESLLDYIPKG
jgi:thiazole synthase